MVQAGTFVAKFVDPCLPEQIQPNGVDLTGRELYRITGCGAITARGTTVADRTPIDWSDQEPLSPGAYILRYHERIAVPHGYVGLIFPRSSLLRNGATLQTAVWDPGYEGRGEGLLLLWHPLLIPPGVRLGQFVLFSAEGYASYQGQWQREG